jgi:hypothetical protein
VHAGVGIVVVAGGAKHGDGVPVTLLQAAGLHQAQMGADPGPNDGGETGLVM